MRSVCAPPSFHPCFSVIRLVANLDKEQRNMKKPLNPSLDFSRISPELLYEAYRIHRRRQRAVRMANLIRRQIKAERQSALTDDLLITAYREHGSYRKAADALVAQGAETNRWAVERAVKRIGGPAAVLRSESSSSIVRAVVSQRNDGRKIFPRNTELGMTQ
jgi:hypothetical protein